MPPTTAGLHASAGPSVSQNRPSDVAPFSSRGGARHALGHLLSGSGVVKGTSRHQGGDKGSEQGFAAAAEVVHDLEEAEVERQLVLRDAPVRPQPGAQQRPEAFHGVDVDLAVAVAVLVAGVSPRPWQTVLWR